MSDIKLLQGDCAEVFKSFDDNTFDLTVTSPPYDNLRLYNGYVFDFEKIARQLFRITKPGGVVVWIVGDATINGSETGTSFKQALYFMECGFNLHDTMIYAKNGFRFPDSCRYNPIFEYMFVFSKDQPKTKNFICDKKNIYHGSSVARESQNRNKDGSLSPNSAWKNNKNKTVKEIGRRDNIWFFSIGGEQEIGDHPAMFPEALARDHILSWSNPGDLVLDPMMGSGTTGKMACLYDRNFVGIEISQEYFSIAEKRIQRVQQQPKIFEVSQ